MKRWMVWAFVGLSATTLGFRPTPVGAAGIQVEPSALRFTIDPGETHKETLTITNGGSEAIDLTTALATVAAARDTGELQFLPNAGVDQQPYTFTIEPQFATLAPSATTTLELAVQTDGAVPPGGYSLGVQLIAQSVAAETPAARIGQRTVTTINVPVLFEVRGQQLLGGELTDFRAQPATLRPNQSTQLTATVKNTGTVHAAATGTLTIYAGDSTQVVDRLVIPRLLVFPGAQRLLEVPWEPEVGRGSYRAVLDVALASADASQPPQLLTAETRVTIAPPAWQWGIIPIGLVAVLAIVVRHRRETTGQRWLVTLDRKRKRKL